MGTQISVFSGTFSATFGGQTVASLFTNLPIDTPFSATFTDSVLPIVTPEPGYAGFTAAALLTAVSLYRVRNRRLGTCFRSGYTELSPSTGDGVKCANLSTLFPPEYV